LISTPKTLRILLVYKFGRQNFGTVAGGADFGDELA